MSTLSDITSRSSQKGHRKARNACQTCKRRKVKCDEKQPTCTNCARFNVPCIVEPVGETPRQGRKMGRPRNDWSQPADTPTSSSSSSDLLSIGTFVPSGTHLELLLHFATHVGPSMADPKDADNVISHFWAHNVPQLGLSFPFVSDLMFALSAHDLASRQIHRQGELLDLADKHFSTGLAELTRLLPSLDETNCGALYISAILVFQCLLAAGPQGPDDLLICRLSDGEQYQRPWTPAIRGVRFILEKIPPDVLYSGWLEPLTPGRDKQASSRRPSYIDQGFARIAWGEPLERLFGFVSSTHDENRSTRLKSFHLLQRIFVATHGIDGDSERDVCPEDKFVFRWLYALDDDFVNCLRQQDAISLIILAYYTPLLKTVNLSWRLESWVAHLGTRARDLVGKEFLDWTEWPLKAAGIN